jgi:hypothetical protein
MELQKINVKFFVQEAEGIALTDFIDVFHSWIQASDGDYHDVADYSHVQEGPGILLVAHEGNISMDNTKGRLGLLYNRKQSLWGSNGERLRTAFRSALEYCCKIEEEPSLKGKINFRSDGILFSVNDRLLAPNTEESFLEIKPELEDFARTLYSGWDFALRHNSDPRQRLTVKMRSVKDFEVSTLLRHIT